MIVAVFHRYGRFGCAREDSRTSVCELGELWEIISKADKIITFDSIRLGRELTLPWNRVEDLSLMAGLLKARTEHSMLALAMEELEYGGAEDYAIHSSKQEGPIPDDVIDRYLVKTAENMLALYDKWHDKIPAEPYRLDLKTGCILSFMERQPIAMNPKAFFQIRSDLKGTRLRIEEEINTLVGKAINPRSHQQVRKALSDKSIKTSGMTGKKEMSTATKYLKKFADNDLVRGILDWRQVEYITKTALPKIEDGLKGSDRIYIQYSLDNRLGEIQPKPMLIERGPCETAMCSLIAIPRGELCLVEYSLKDLDILLHQHMSGEKNKYKAMWAAKSYGCVRLTSGRKIWIDDREQWKALEMWIMGTRADYIKKLVVRLASEGHCPYFLLPDAIFIVQDSSASYSKVRTIVQEVLGVDAFPLEW